MKRGCIVVNKTFSIQLGCCHSVEWRFQHRLMVHEILTEEIKLNVFVLSFHRRNTFKKFVRRDCPTQLESLSNRIVAKQQVKPTGDSVKNTKQKHASPSRNAHPTWNVITNGIKVEHHCLIRNIWIGFVYWKRTRAHLFCQCLELSNISESLTTIIFSKLPSYTKSHRH